MCRSLWHQSRAPAAPAHARSGVVERDKEVEEQKRLLYVALTRSQHLLVLGEGASKRPGPWHTWVMGTLLAEPERAEIIGQVRSRTLPSADIALDSVTIELRQASTLAQQPVTPVVATSSLPTATADELQAIDQRVWGWQPTPPQTVELSPTALAMLAKCPRYFFLHDWPVWRNSRRGRTGVAGGGQGRIVHAVLERIEMDLPVAALADRVRELIHGSRGRFS